jgi:hypothetical protein
VYSTKETKRLSIPKDIEESKSVLSFMPSNTIRYNTMERNLAEIQFNDYVPLVCVNVMCLRQGRTQKGGRVGPSPPGIFRKHFIFSHLSNFFIIYEQ